MVNEGVDAVAVAVAVEIAMETTVNHGMGREGVAEEEVEEEVEEEAGEEVEEVVGMIGENTFLKVILKGKCTGCRVKNVPRCNRILNTGKNGRNTGKSEIRKSKRQIKLILNIAGINAESTNRQIKELTEDEKKAEKLRKLKVKLRDTDPEHFWLSQDLERELSNALRKLQSNVNFSKKKRPDGNSVGEMNGPNKQRTKRDTGITTKITSCQQKPLLT